MPDVPQRLVFDLEIARPIPQKNGKADWDNAAKSGISVLCGWKTLDLSPFIWMLDSARLPRVFLTEDHCTSYFKDAEAVVSWNGVHFDNKLMARNAPDAYKAYRKAKHVDLMAICALIQAGIDAERLEGGVPDEWEKMVPNLRGGYLHQGWNLNAACRGTLKDVGKMEGDFTGAGAPDAWQQGRYSEVTSYCISDVALTRALYLHAWEHGWMASTERGRVEIPRSVL